VTFDQWTPRHWRLHLPAQEKAALGMTAQEKAALDALVAAWNCFVALPQMHPDDTTEFRHLIHAAQDKIMSRPTRRALNGDPLS